MKVSFIPMKKISIYLQLLRPLRENSLQAQELEKLPQLIKALGPSCSVNHALALARDARVEEGNKNIEARENMWRFMKKIN